MNSNDQNLTDPRSDEFEIESTKGDLGNQPVTRPVNYKKGFLRELLGLILIGFMVLVFRSSLVEPFKIPTGSMIPTLRIGDFILVNKFAYGLKLPFSDLSIGGLNLDPIYLFGQKPIQRGDVIVFKYPKDPSINYIKRVIGLPGDVIEIKEKKVYVNGDMLDLEKLPSRPYMKTMDSKFRDNNLAFYKAKIEGGSFIYQVDNDNFFKVDYPKRTVPKDKYFVMGDNRDFSYDSRYWGMVPRSNIKGKAFLVWLSLNIPEDSGEDIEFRSDRFGHIIN